MRSFFLLGVRSLKKSVPVLCTAKSVHVSQLQRLAFVAVVRVHTHAGGADWCPALAHAL